MDILKLFEDTGINCVYTVLVLFVALLFSLPTLLPRVLKKKEPHEFSIGGWFAIVGGYVFSLIVVLALFGSIYNVMIHNIDLDKTVDFFNPSNPPFIKWWLFGQLDLKYPSQAMLATDIPFASHAFALVTSIYVGIVYSAICNIKHKAQSLIGGISCVLFFVILFTVLTDVSFLTLGRLTLATYSLLLGLLGAIVTDVIIEQKREG